MSHVTVPDLRIGGEPTQVPVTSKQTPDKQPWAKNRVMVVFVAASICRRQLSSKDEANHGSDDFTSVEASAALLASDHVRLFGPG